MRLDLDTELLEMLYNRAVHRTPKISMLISDGTRLVANPVEDVLRYVAVCQKTQEYEDDASRQT